MTIVLSVIAFSIAATSARKSAATGTWTISMSKYWAALSNAAWAVSGTTICGFVMPFLSLA